MTIPAIAAQIVDIQTGTIMFDALLAPKELLIAITVVGINCIDAVFNIIKVIISLVIFPLFLFIFYRLSIAFNPIGVAAFPNPKIYAIIFIEIYS